MYPLNFSQLVLAWRRKTLQTLQVPLSPPGVNLSTATKKARFKLPHSQAGRIVGFVVTCDPANKPSAAHAQFDFSVENATTGALTSILLAVTQVSTGTNVGAGVIAGSEYRAPAGTVFCIGVPQGSDGKEYVAEIFYYPVV